MLYWFFRYRLMMSILICLFAEHETGINKCDISFPPKNEMANVIQILNISVRIINVTSHKQHAIQCNFVIATKSIEKIIIGKLTNSYCCNSQNCKRYDLLEKSFALFCYLFYNWYWMKEYGQTINHFPWHLEVTLWPLNASMIHSKVDLAVHQKYISWNRI